MHRVEYFRKLNGKVPTQDWLDKQEYGISAGFLAKFRMIESEGLNLLQTRVLKRVIGQPNLYEVIYSKYRIITYFDEKIDTFMMMNGFKKQKMNEKMEIERGIRLMKEYLAIYGGNK